MSNIQVEVVYALSTRQYLRKVKLPAGSNVQQALQHSGLLDICHAIDLKNNNFGIYSHPVKLGHLLNDGDRVEIYRPLIANPKELYRQRVAKIKKIKR